ncbi:heavy metal translocating P-type ATPase [Shewanella surugensis]|uniref:Cadmium-translocating P-type ATPase n=1 Tax=Shewanella surugensis TaxID=212020 RepID=A0ABT0LD91_9GAMM|nr:heavy metal translocating P-type ATPase [Shewanella surugensis]MCL1125681.1 cadmium-translocating P-type ATPase [Shewanella surugensis]
MEQKSDFTPLDIILPDIIGDQDACIAKLESLLQSHSGVEKAHITRTEDKTGICVHYNPEVLTLKQTQALIALSGAKLSQQFQHMSLHVKGMDCTDCAIIIEHALTRLEGVIAAKVSYSGSQLRLEFDSNVISYKKIAQKISKLGYKLSDQNETKTWWQENRELAISLFSGVLLLLSWIIDKYNPGLGTSLAITAFVFAGWLTFRDSLQTIMQKRFDIDVLMLFAAIGAATMGLWAEGALLLFLFSLGHSLEHKAMDRARQAVKALADLAPKTALINRDGVEQEVPVETLQLDDLVIIKPGQHIPVDGIIISGTTTVDQAPITGESIPVDKQAEDSVFAGTINGDGNIQVSVTKLTENTTLNRMVRMVLEADTQKSPTQQFTNRFVKYFVPSVLVLVVGFIFIPPLVFNMPWGEAFYRAMSILVAASPCALAIATPAAILSGVARAAQKGVLIKGGMHLENLGRIKAIAFDKTGTLTQGKPEVQSIRTLNGDEESLLTIAASLERLSTHPLAKAIVDLAEQRQLTLLAVEDMQSVTGKGLSGQLDGKTLLVGSLRLFETIPAEIEGSVSELESLGYTTMIVKHGDEWLGIIGLADTVRSESANAIKGLLATGLEKTIMLTGDNSAVANAVAKKVGISEVRANLLPEDKLTEITRLEKELGYIAMVGDGINDAPAMARATVGIAMGGAGTDVALEASDVALMADDLTRLPFAIGLSRSAQKIIRQNLAISLSVVAFLLVATMTGFAGLGLAVTIHEGSTLVVVANALRLLRHQ